MAMTSSGFDLDILKKQSANSSLEQLKKSLANSEIFAKGDQQVKDFYQQKINQMSGVTQPVVNQPVAQPLQQAVQTQQPSNFTGSLIKYRDQAGNLQEIDSSYEASGNVPQGWIKDSAPTQSKAPNMSDMISQRSQARTNELVSALKQRIAESQASQKALIDKAPQQYDPLRAESEVAKAQSLKSVLERNANMGDRGGIGRSEALATQTAGENRLGAINLQQQNFVDQANNEIARLESEGKFQEAQIVASQKSQELQDLLAERGLQEGYARQDALTADQRAYNQGLTTEQRDYNEGLDAKTLGLKNAEIARQRELDTIGQYSNDYQSEINRRQATPDTSDDWLIPYLKDVRGQKVASIAQATTKAEQTAYERAIKEKESQDKLNLERLKLQQAKEKADADRKISQQKANKATAPKVTTQKKSTFP